MGYSKWARDAISALDSTSEAQPACDLQLACTVEAITGRCRREDPHGARSQVGGGARTTEKTPGGSRQRENASYNDFARRNGSGLCRDATMLRDILVGSSRRCSWARKFVFRALPTC